MVKAKQRTIRARSFQARMNGAVVSPSALASIAEQAGLRLVVSDFDAIADELREVFFGYVMLTGADLPRTASDYRQWADRVAAAGGELLTLLGQPAGTPFVVREGAIALLIPGLEQLRQEQSRAHRAASQSCAGSWLNQHDPAIRACWSVELLIALADSTAEFWRKRQRPGPLPKTANRGLVDGLALAFERLTGQPATVGTRAEDGERYGAALDFMKAFIALAADRMEEGLRHPLGEAPADVLQVKPPEGIEAADLVRQLRALAQAPHALASLLRQRNARPGRARGRPSTRAAPPQP